MMPGMTRAFEGEGLMGYSIDGLTGNTMNSHRLIAVAEQLGKQDDMVEELFKNYFLEAKHLNDRDVLLAAALKVGIPDAEAVVDTPTTGLSEVKEQLMRGRGVTGVPHFIVDKKFRIGGAQESDTFEELFNEIIEKAT
mmetsp:Transcript_27522/g.88300  ORF Transcript_27522/g.88300 Transcript_27522/m.88300 type:complete len:138 (+) Transcript_27522:227-640(+)